MTHEEIKTFLKEILTREKQLAGVQEDKDYARQCADEKWRSQYR